MTLHNVKSFDLGGITYPVWYVQEIESDPNLNGMAYLEKRFIRIRDDLDKDRASQVFCHELTHCILSIMGNELCDDEEFVDLFGTFLQQALKTIK